MGEIWPSPAKACLQIRDQPAGACPQMSGGVLGLGVCVFGSCPIRPVRRIRPVTPRQNNPPGPVPTPFHKMRIQCGILFHFLSAQNPQPSDCLLPHDKSRTGRSVFVSRRPALTLSCSAPADIRERRVAPFRVCAKRPALCHRAACGRDHESRRRRAPPATNAPCGRHETYPASRRVTKALCPAIDLQAALTPNVL